MFEWLQNWLVYHVSQVWKTLLLWFVGLLLRGDNVLGGFPELYLGSVATTWYLSVLSLLPECTHDSTGCCGLIWPHTVDFNIFTGQIVPPGNVFEFERVSLIDLTSVPNERNKQWFQCTGGIAQNSVHTWQQNSEAAVLRWAAGRSEGEGFDMRAWAQVSSLHVKV